MEDILKGRYCHRSLWKIDTRWDSHAIS